MTNPAMRQGKATGDKPCESAGEGCVCLPVTYDLAWGVNAQVGGTTKMTDCGKRGIEHI